MQNSGKREPTFTDPTVSTITLRCSNLPVPELSQPVASSIIALFAIICFTWSLGGDFVFDDNEAILNNKDVRQESGIVSLFKHDFWGNNITSKSSHKSYRPLTVWTFRLNYWAAGDYKPIGFHMVNIMLHAFNCMLALRVFSAVFGGIALSSVGIKVFTAPKSSFLAAVLFATHPIHTENVAGIVGRADLLCAFFFFVSFLSYVRCFSSAFRKTPSLLPERIQSNSLCACVVFAFFAMLSKEQGVTVLAVCIIYDIMQILAAKKFTLLKIVKTGCIKDEEQRWLLAFVKRISILLVTSIIFLMLRMKIMGANPPKFQPSDNPSAFAKSWPLRVVNYNYIYSMNMWLLLNPFWLCFDWAMGCVPLIETGTDSRLIGPILLWICLLMLLWKSWQAIESHLGRTVILYVAFLVIPFLPSTNIFFTVGFVIAERNLYLSSVGFVGIVVIGTVVLCQENHIRKVVKVCLFLVVIIFVSRCCMRTQDWLTEEKLFRSGEKVCPLNAKVHYNIGNVVSKKGDTDGAIKYYRDSIRLNPTYDQPLNNLGNILQSLGKPSEAEKLLEKAVQISPKFAAGWMNLGVTKADLKKYKEAELCYMNAIKIRNFYPDAYYNLANLYLEMKNFTKAIESYKRVIDMKPDHESSWINLILLLEEIGNLNESFALSKKVENILPKSPGISFALGSLHGRTDRYLVFQREDLVVECLKTDRATNSVPECIVLDLLKPCSSRNAKLSFGGKLELSRFMIPTLEVATSANTVFMEAERFFLRALKMKPNDASYNGNLAVLYHRWKRYDEAKEYYLRSLRIDPKNAMTSANFEKLKKTMAKIV